MYWKTVDFHPLHNDESENQRILIASFITDIEIFVVWWKVSWLDLKEQYWEEFFSKDQTVEQKLYLSINLPAI